ncbi:MAG: hypothetical protein IK082_11060 [Oscillospiraceae bacterium]|nr:hypothetical protein [Oscillospiraceae bacterium]
MKKTISLLLVLLLTLGLFAACQKLEERTDGTAPADAASEVLLPLGLEFGMTYEEFTAKLAENGFTFASWETPKNHESDTGFDSPQLNIFGYENPAFDWTFLHSPTFSAEWGADSSMQTVYFQFDDNRKLYGVHCLLDGKDPDKTCSEVEAFLDGFFPVNIRKTRGEDGFITYKSWLYYAYLYPFNYSSGLIYGFESKAGVTLSERATEPPAPSDEEIGDRIAEILNQTPLHEASRTSIGRMIARVFDDYTLSFKHQSGSVYDATISGDFVPIADIPYYTLHGSITYRIDIERGTCEMIDNPDDVYAILVSRLFS